MAAPKVQTIAQAMAELNPAYAESKAIVGKQQAGLGAKYDAQRAGITAERGEGFNVINNQATARGGSFSGIPVEEQARYLSTKFLPGMQQADYQQNEEGLALQGQIAAMNKELRTNAVGRVDQQKSALNSWNMQQQTLEQQRKEAEKQRKFQAGESALDRAASAAEAAAGRTSSQVNAYDTIETMLQASMGADRKVSPTAWKQAAGYAKRNGLNFEGKDGFASTFWNYANDKYWKEYKNIKV